MRDGARAIRSGRRRNRIDLGAICRRSAIHGGQPMGSRIGQRARVDARVSSALDSAVSQITDDGRSLAYGGPEADEESVYQPSVLLGGFRAGGRWQMIRIVSRGAA